MQYHIVILVLLSPFLATQVLKTSFHIGMQHVFLLIYVSENIYNPLILCVYSDGKLFFKTTDGKLDDQILPCAWVMVFLSTSLILTFLTTHVRF